MEINNGVSCTATISSMSLSEFMNVLRQMNGNYKPLSLDVDLYLLIMSKHRSECSSSAKAKKEISMMRIFSHCGRTCNPIAGSLIAITRKEHQWKGEQQKYSTTLKPHQLDAN